MANTDSRTVCVYKHTSPNGKSYIGQTVDYAKRCNDHQKDKGDRPFNRAIAKYGWNSFNHQILIDGLTLVEANELEAFFIDWLGTMWPHGYNMRSGGEVSRHSPESKAKMSAALKGRIKSPEHRAKLSQAGKGRPKSTSELAKISAASRGRKLGPRPPETIARLCAAQQKRWARDKGLVKMSPRSQEHRAKQSVAITGKRASDETRMKMSISGKARWARLREHI